MKPHRTNWLPLLIALVLAILCKAAFGQMPPIPVAPTNSIVPVKKFTATATVTHAATMLKPSAAVVASVPQLTFTWVNQTGPVLVLQSTTDLTATNCWSGVTNIPVLQPTTVTVARTNNIQFFRIGLKWSPITLVPQWFTNS